MSRRAFRAMLSVAVATSALFVGCDDRDPGEQSAPDTTAANSLSFPSPAFPSRRALDTLFSVDLDDDGRREYVVASLELDSMLAPGARADQVEIYRYDTVSRSWKVILTDTLLWATSYLLREMTGDRAPEIVAQISGGGNDPIATNGMRIYSGHGGTIRTIFSRDDGDPIIGAVERSERPVVIVHDLIWPPLVPHVQSVPYVADLLAFDGTAMASIRSSHAEYFRKEADALLAEYAEGLKEAGAADAEPVDEEGFSDAEFPDGSLFATTAQAIIALEQSGQTPTLRAFWNRERDTLRAVLPEEQFDQLEELYAEKIMR